MWPRPAMERDDEHGIAWKLRYQPDRISRAEQIEAAETMDAYAYLLCETTQAQRDRICRGVREALAKEEA